MEHLCPARVGTAEHVAKRSRFIGSASPAFSSEEAEAFVGSIKEKHPLARHNVYAYSVGTGTPLERLSDDGEPRGTAGYPILEVIHKRELKNAVCVVTRYFGGILLGAGGLLRAYGKAASMALDDAGVARSVYHSLLRVKVTYDLFGRVQRELEGRGALFEDTDFGESVTIAAYVKAEDSEAISARVRDLSAGKAHVEILEGKVITKPLEESKSE